MSEVVNRNVPRRLASDAAEAFERIRPHGGAIDLPANTDSSSAAVSEVKPSASVDPIAVGMQASEGVASYITAAQDIEATVASTRRMADAIERDGTALAAALRRQGEAMEKMVANFAKLGAGTQQRMADERKRLEEINVRPQETVQQSDAAR